VRRQNIDPPLAAQGGRAREKIDALGELALGLVKMPEPPPGHDPTVARYVARIIDDGATLQIGLGRVPNEMLRFLGDRRDLGIHSDVITVFAALPSGSATAADSAIMGVWSCPHTRPGSTVTRPLTFVFHHDGTFAFSSQTTVNGGPLDLPFNGRGGGLGVWKKTGKSTYSYLVREDLYIDGNAGGFFYADATLQLDRKLGELAAGRRSVPARRPTSG
jgi:hypothetical protein